MDLEKLIRVSTYAKKENISVQTVYDRIKDKKLDCVIIDGIKYVKNE
jgi:hypothetical protein